jgi:hypothetical protein
MIEILNVLVPALLALCLPGAILYVIYLIARSISYIAEYLSGSERFAAYIFWAVILTPYVLLEFLV